MTDTLVLDGNGGTTPVFNGQSLDISGTAASETLVANQGAQITQFMANQGDRVELNGSIGDYDITASGNTITFTDTTGENASAVTVALNATTAIAFADGSTEARIDTSGDVPRVQLGGLDVDESFSTDAVALDAGSTSSADTVAAGTGLAEGATAQTVVRESTPREFGVNDGVVTQLLGDTGGKIVNVSRNAGVTDVEPGTTVNLEHGSDDVQLIRDGAELEIRDGAGELLARLTAGTEAATEVRFLDGAAELSRDGQGGMTFGGVSIPEDTTIQGGQAGLSLDKLNPSTDAFLGQGTFEVSQAGRFVAPGTALADGAAEIAAHDPASQRIFVTNGNSDTLDVLDVSEPGNITRVNQIDFADAFSNVGGVNHVEVKNGTVAVALENSDGTANGRVAFLNTDGTVQNVVEVGVLPDNLKISPDGNTVVVANEAEPTDTADPKGSISIIDLSNGVANATVTTRDFTAFDSQQQALENEGVRIFPNKTLSNDIEPEGVAISPDGTQARVTLQENNALAVVDLQTNEITDIQALGTKDFSTADNGLDAKEDGRIDIQNLPLKGMFMPDQIAAFDSGGETFYVTANEGDDREPTDLVPASQVLNNDGFSDRAAETIRNNGLQDLDVSRIDGDTDGDGQIEEITTFGSRSFSIWNSDGQIVFDSGSDFAEIQAAQIPNGFNSDDEEDAFDSESEEAGPEVESVTTGQIDGKMHAFIGLEKPGGVMVYDVSSPSDAKFVDYINNREFDQNLDQSTEDSGPEGLEFIAAEDSPTGGPALATANEITNSVSLFDLG